LNVVDSELSDTEVSCSHQVVNVITPFSLVFFNM